MTIRQYRGVDFINRDKEISFFLDYFKNKPERVLWVYGPKSTGKTTLIEYIVENHLMQDPSYNVKYINFRGKMIANYENFIDAFIKPKDSPFFKYVSATINLHFLKIDSKLYEDIKNKRLDFFEAVQEEFLNYSNNKRNILIIDEIQTLQDIYINGNRELLNEFLNFCVRLTKETHLSHVVILTSNTIFLNQIYNNSKMKKTSKFKLIDHLSYKEIESWLTNNYQLSIDNSQLIYDYLGGCASDIKKLLEEYKEFDSLEEYLENETKIAKNEIIFEKNRDLTNKEFEIFLQIAKKIIKDGYFVFDENDEERRKELKSVIERFCNVEILFFDPIKNRVIANSKIYIKAFERMMVDSN